jgi:hypothetical protein
MDRPVQLVALFGGLLLLECSVVAGENAPSQPKRERVVSSRVAEMLNAAAPKYEPLPTAAEKPAEAAQATPAARARLSVPTEPANTIVRLPDYVVRERKPRPLPKYEEVISPRELEKLAMQEFLGDERGFDRGFLNLFNLASLWKKVPVLGQIPLPGFQTNEDRAMGMYRADRNAKAWAEATGLLTPAERKAIASPTGAAPVVK